MAFAKQMAEQAALATGAGTDTKSEEQRWREEVKAMLAAGPEVINKAIDTLIDRLWAKLMERAAPKAWEPLKAGQEVAAYGVTGAVTAALARRAIG
jgi:hypothetical protein